MKKFLYTKMLMKGGRLGIKLIVSFVVAFFASEQVAHNLEQIGMTVDPDQLGLALAGALTAALEMSSNFKKHGGAERVKEDAVKVKSGTIKVLEKVKIKKVIK